MKSGEIPYRELQNRLLLREVMTYAGLDISCIPSSFIAYFYSGLGAMLILSALRYTFELKMHI